MSREEVGVAVECTVCGQRKQPRGRSAPLGLRMCDNDCPGYYLDPKPGELRSLSAGAAGSRALRSAVTITSR